MMGIRILDYLFIDLLVQYMTWNDTISQQNYSNSLDSNFSHVNFFPNAVNGHDETQGHLNNQLYSGNHTIAEVSSVKNLSTNVIAERIRLIWTAFNSTLPQTSSSGYDDMFDLSKNQTYTKKIPLGERETSSVLSVPSLAIPESFKKLSTSSRNCVIAYLILFCVGAPCNLFVFISVGREMLRRQLIRSRIKVLIWHLATADLIVTFVVIPIEVFWRLTIQWYGGNVLCKLAQFFRAFGLYLSSMIIICISLDRFFAIVFPLKVIGGMKRVRNMLSIAWTFSILFALPQFLVFRVQSHPIYTSFLLCSNSDYFLSLSKEIMYNLLSLIVMYFAPLIVIIVTYAMVLFKISQKSREHRQSCQPRNGSCQLRRSDNASMMTRAKRKTLWLSMIIVTVFVLCWTPYVSTTLWYMFDFETADKLVDPQIHEAFFVTAVSNSCVNPIIYGNYMKKYWDILRNTTCQSTSPLGSSNVISLPRGMNQVDSPLKVRCKCSNPNHHRSSSRPCQSTTNTSDVTIVLREFPISQFARDVVPATTTTISTSMNSRTTATIANQFII